PRRTRRRRASLARGGSRPRDAASGPKPSCLVEDAGDGARRAIGVRLLAERAVGPAIAEGDSAFALEAVERCLIGEIIAVVMRDRHVDHLALGIAAREDRLAGLDAQMDVAAMEAQRLVGEKRAGEEPRFGDDLKP